MSLPLEVMLLVVQSMALSAASVPLEPLDPTSEFPRVGRKPDFTDLKPLSSACRWLHEVVRQFWFTTLYIRDIGDWKIAKDFDICQHVREIRVFSAALTEATPNNAFFDYQKLHTAFVDVHHDFVPTARQPSSPHLRSTTLGRYQLLVARMPPSLRRLWVVNAHGPDASVIRAAGRSCPKLEELSISRCTMFSPRLKHHSNEDTDVGACQYWALFPGEHDSYFSADGVEEYAKTLAQELKPLSNLKKLHMGLYLTPYDAVETHARVHVGTTPNLCFWKTTCSECNTAYGDSTRKTEEIASRIIFSSQSHLAEISWASFFIEDRLGVSLHTK